MKRQSTQNYANVSMVLFLLLSIGMIPFAWGYLQDTQQKIKQIEQRDNCCLEPFKTNLENAGKCNYVSGMHDKQLFVFTDYESSYYSCYKDGNVQIIKLDMWCEKPCQ